MRDDLGNLAWLYAVVESEVDIVRHLCRLVACDQGGEGNDAAVPWTEFWTLPQFGDGTLRVLLKRRRHHVDFA